MSRFHDRASNVLPSRDDVVLVAGLGVSGEGAARALARLGVRLHVADDADDARTRAAASALGAERVFLGPMDASLLDDVDLVVVSPGVRPSHTIARAAEEAKIPVWSEVELAWRTTEVPILGVTGTNGKTTTTEMLTAALNAAGLAATAAGNIGMALCDAAHEASGVIVAELSSFQLHGIVSFRAPVGALLNIAEDHLDWHESMDAYVADKARMFENQRPGDTAIALDEPVCRAAAQTRGTQVLFSASTPPNRGAGVSGGAIVVPQGTVVAVERLKVRGAALLSDAVAAATAACAYGAEPAAVGEALASFTPGEHRMEWVATIDGVDYINDSKATNPHASLSALSGMRNVILIAGGRNKGLSMAPLARTQAVQGVVAIGEATSEVEAAFAAHQVPVRRATGMEEAVDVAASMAIEGGTVLLSPACSSFDMFDGYAARGSAFRDAVVRLASRGGTR